MQKFYSLPLKRKTQHLRLITTLWFVACFMLGGSVVQAQDSAFRYDEKRVNIHLHNATLATVIKQIQKQCDTYILFNSSVGKGLNSLDINVENATIAEVLDLCLRGTSLEWVLKDDTFIIQVIDTLRHQNPPVSAATRKKATVSGIVTHRITKEPLVGVIVVFEGSTNGVITDSQGRYTLERPSKGGTLVASLLGMETRRVPITNEETINIVLVDKVETLDNVIITGYSNIKKESFTGNSTRINKEQLMKVSPQNIMSAIQVFDPSFRLQENLAAGSNPNVMPDFVLRGQTGIGVTELDKAQGSTTSLSRQNLNGNSNLPIFILDGFEVSVEKIVDMDMTRIHSLNILKDAAATAMYGSRAANGVIVIESRSPEAGKLRVQYTGGISIEAPDLSSYNLMNASEKLETERIAGFFDSKNPSVDPYTNEYYRRKNNILQGVDTYWLSQGLRTPVNHRHSVYVDGGENDLRWGLSANADYQNGVMKHSSRNVLGASFYVDYRIGKFQIRNKVSYDNTKSKDVPYNKFSDYSHLLPYLRVYDDQGNYVRNLENFSSSTSGAVNPLYEVSRYKSRDESSLNDLTNNLSVNWDIVNHLRLRASLAVQTVSSEGELFKDPASASYSSNSTELNGDLTMASTRRNTVEGTLNLMYNNTIKDHNLNLNLAGNIRSTQDEANNTSYRGFPSGSLSSPNYAKEVVGKPYYSDRKSRLLGLVLSGNYTYKNIYLADLQGRLDGSSEFGANRRWSFFWATGLGLNIHNYEFMAGNPVISTLKVRGSYGLTGKTNFPLNAALDMYELQTDSWYSTGYGLYLSNMGNLNLKWEKKYSLDCGVELGLWKELIFLKASYYHEKTVDLITDYSIPSSTGFTSYRQNMGAVKNTGVELDLRINLLQQKDWKLSFFGNFSRNKNVIVEISEAMRNYNKRVEDIFKDQHGTSYFSKTWTKYYEGASMTAISGMKSLGISPTNGREIYLLRDGDVTDTWSPEDWMVIGDTEPKGRGAFGFNLSWKNLSMFTSFMYQFGGDQYNGTLVSNVENADIKNNNVDKRVLLDRWQKPGDVTSLKDIKDRNKNTGQTSRFIQRNNTLELSSLTLSYDWDALFLRRLNVGMCRFSLTMNNLFYASSIRRERGLDYPYARNFNLTINLSL